VISWMLNCLVSREEWMSCLQVNKDCIIIENCKIYVCSKLSLVYLVTDLWPINGSAKILVELLFGYIFSSKNVKLVIIYGFLVSIWSSFFKNWCNLIFFLLNFLKQSRNFSSKLTSELCQLHQQNKPSLFKTSFLMKKLWPNSKN